MASPKKKFVVPSLDEMAVARKETPRVDSVFNKHKQNAVESRPSTSGQQHSAPQSTGIRTGDVPKPSAITTETSSPRKLGSLSTNSPKKLEPGVANSPSKSGLSPVKIVPVEPQSTTTGIKPVRAVKTNALLVSSRQRGNPLLKHVRSVPWEFSDIVPDYEMAATACALFLSLRYHNLNPKYIHERLKLLGKSYDLRVLLVQVDITDPHRQLKELSKICLLADCTLILSWSPEEAARYLETYKVFENKPPDLIMERGDTDYVSTVQDLFTAGRRVNRSDALTLLNAFGSVAGVLGASEDEMALCPGVGLLKAKRLHAAVNEDFIRHKASKK